MFDFIINRIKPKSNVCNYFDEISIWLESYQLQEPTDNLDELEETLDYQLANNM